MRPSTIKVNDIRLIHGKPSLKAFATVQLDDWLIHDFRVIKQNGQKASVSPPQVSWKDPETGQIRFKGILTLPPELKQMIDIEILHVYQAEMENSGGNRR